MKKFKFVIAAACVAALAVCALAGCTSSSSSSAASASGSTSAASASASAASASASSAAATTKFIVGFDAEYPPYGFKAADGSYTGFDLDLAQAVCEMNGWEYEAKPIDWDAKEMELDSATITCIWNGFTLTDERKEKMCCTPAYLGNAQVAVVRADSGIASLADLAGKKVGTQTGSSGEECVNKNEAFKASLQELVLIDNYLNAFMQLESGAIDAIVMDEIVAAYQIPVSGKAFAMLGEHLAPEEYGIAFRKDNTALRDQVWDALKALAAEGKVAEIDAKWFAKDLSVIK